MNLAYLGSPPPWRRLAARTAALAGAQPAAPAKARPSAPSRLRPPSCPNRDLHARATASQVAVLPPSTPPRWSRSRSGTASAAKDEPRDRRGSAHMFEHMMFKGTEHVPPEEHARSSTGVGGYVNAHDRRGRDRTTSTRCPPTTSTSRSQLEAERMRNLLFREDMIDDRARGREGGDPAAGERPIAKGFLRFLEIAFTQAPVRVDRGRHDRGPRRARRPPTSRSSTTPTTSPGNAMLVVVGKTHARRRSRPRAEKYFGAIPKAPRRRRAPPTRRAEPPQTAKRREVVEPGQIGLVLRRLQAAAGEGTRTSTRCRSRRSCSAPASRRGCGSASRRPTRRPRSRSRSTAGMAVLVREHPGLFARARRVSRSGRRRGGRGGDPRRDREARRASRPSGDELRKAKNQILSGFVFGARQPAGPRRADRPVVDPHRRPDAVHRATSTRSRR